MTLRPGFVTVVCFSAYFGSAALLAVFLFAACIHELGHVAAAKAMGLHIRKLTLSAQGAELTLQERNTTFTQDLLLALSGPAVNLMAVLLCALLERWPLFLGVNLLLGCFNLLPVLPLDGGCAVNALLSSVTSWDRACRFMRCISCAFAFAVLFIGVTIFAMDGGKPYLLLLGIWLFVTANFSACN